MACSLFLSGIISNLEATFRALIQWCDWYGDSQNQDDFLGIEGVVARV